MLSRAYTERKTGVRPRIRRMPSAATIRLNSEKHLAGSNAANQHSRIRDAKGFLRVVLESSTTRIASRGTPTNLAQVLRLPAFSDYFDFGACPRKEMTGASPFVLREIPLMARLIER